MRKVYVIIRKVRYHDDPDYNATKRVEPVAFEDEKSAIAEAERCLRVIQRNAELGYKLFHISFEIEELELK